MIGLALLKIPVSDLVRSVEFYEKVLGHSAVFTAEEFGWAQFEFADIGLALYVPGKGGGDRVIGGSVDFHFHHPNLDGLQEQLPENADQIGLHENADGSKSLEFCDPDGNVIKIMERSSA
ncbi:MAG: VOC family protein [Alphaproteobacteria bacterium]|nr:VOC family protein [Alphaproteobacteria bacterium]